MIDGVTVSGDSEVSVLIIEELTEDLKTRLRDHLSTLCYGGHFVASEPKYYSFSRTVAEFLRRYDTKQPTMQIGMIGELLVHVLAAFVYPDLETSSVYFNKEERNIKKGFDLTFFDSAGSGVWYTEVKSGEVQTGTPTEKAAKLFHDAAVDLADKLTATDRRSLWDAAQIDATLTLAETSLGTVRAILRRDEMASGEGVEWQKLGILAASVFHPVAQAVVDHPELIAHVATSTLGDKFDEIRLLALQKSTFAKIVDFLREEGAA